MTIQRFFTILSLMLNLALVSCSPVTTPIVKERKSKIIIYKAKRFQPTITSTIRKSTQQNDHLYYNKKGDITKEVIYGESIGGALVKNNQIVGSWSGTDYKKIGLVIDYFYENNELKRTETWRYRNNKKDGESDTVNCEDEKKIQPNIEVIRNGDWKIHKGLNYVDSIKLDNKDRVVLEKRYLDGKLTFFLQYEYNGPTTIKNDYYIRYGGDTARSMNIIHTQYMNNKSNRIIWELELRSNLSSATRILYIYNKHGYLSKKLYYKSDTVNGIEELEYYYMYRYKYY